MLYLVHSDSCLAKALTLFSHVLLFSSPVIYKYWNSNEKLPFFLIILYNNPTFSGTFSEVNFSLFFLLGKKNIVSEILCQIRTTHLRKITYFDFLLLFWSLFISLTHWLFKFPSSPYISILIMQDFLLSHVTQSLVGHSLPRQF